MSLAFFFGNARHRKSPDDKPADMVPLTKAAAEVLETMRKREYAMAGVADLNRTEEEAIAWIAENMIGIVPVYEQGATGWHRAAKGPVAGRTLAVPPSGIKAYLDWAQHVY